MLTKSKVAEFQSRLPKLLLDTINCLLAPVYATIDYSTSWSVHSLSILAKLVSFYHHLTQTRHLQTLRAGHSSSKSTRQLC